MQLDLIDIENIQFISVAIKQAWRTTYYNCW